jgi:hypothetical protein
MKPEEKVIDTSVKKGIQIKLGSQVINITKYYVI